MEWVVAAAVVAVAALAALLLVPLRLFAGLCSDGPPHWFWEITALGGLVRLGRDNGGNYWACGRIRRALAPPAGKARAASPAERGRALLATWREFDGGVRQAFLKMLSAVWQALDIAVRGNIRYGFTDPAVTAWLHALLCVVRGSGRLPAFAAEADFAFAGWSGQATAVVTARPISVVLPGVRFLLTIITRRIGKKWTGGKKRWLVQT